MLWELLPHQLEEEVEMGLSEDARMTWADAVANRERPTALRNNILRVGEECSGKD